MNPHRNGDRFPEREVKADPRLLRAIQRRAPKVSGTGGAMYHTHNGVIIEPERPRRGRKSVGRFNVSFDATNQRLHVGPGSVVYANAEKDHQEIKPEIPTLDNVSLTENPYWEVAGKATGVIYNVWCVVGGDSAHSKMQLRKDTEDVEWEFPEENARCVAHLTFKSGSGGLEIDGEIHQDWSDDIEWFKAAGDGSSSYSEGSEDESSDTGSSDGGSDDSSTIIDDSSDDDSSDDSSDDDDSSGTFYCPTVEIVHVGIIEIEGGGFAPDGTACFNDINGDGALEGAYVTAQVVVYIGQLSLEGCYPYLRVFRDGPLGGAGTTNLSYALAPQTATVTLRFFAFPNTAVTLVAQVRHPASSKPGCMQYNSCPNSEDYIAIMPGGC